MRPVSNMSKDFFYLLPGTILQDKRFQSGQKFQTPIKISCCEYIYKKYNNTYCDLCTSLFTICTKIVINCGSKFVFV